MKSNILLLEDDISLSDTIKQFLEHKGYNVFCAYDGFTAQDLAYEKQIDLMLLDVKVPHLSGFEFLKKLRSEGKETPAIFITSLHGIDDVEKGFTLGCDDYIRKPFALKELSVRIESLLKRQFGSHSDITEVNNNLQFDLLNLTLLKDNKEIKLKNKEVKLLKLFLTHPNEVINRSKIFETLWEYGEEPNDGSLRTYIKVLRSHIGRESIETIKNVGYRYVKK